jgi:hypothetical protein
MGRRRPQIERLIVKVQFPIVSSDAEGMNQCLVYSEDRALHQHLPIDQDLSDVMGDDLKAFFRADYHWSTGQLTLQGRAPCQDW